MTKTAMIWGAAGGIGQAMVSTLKERDWQVVAITHKDSMLEPGLGHQIQADVGDVFSVQSAVQAASFEVDQIDLWIYAAGDIAFSKIADMGPEAWHRIVNANLSGAHLTTHYSLPLLAADAHLFYLGAVSERLRLPGLAAYVAAKAGLEAYVDALRKEQRGRPVTLIRPGAVATPFWEKVPMRLPKDAASPEKVARRILRAYDDGHSGNLDLT